MFKITDAKGFQITFANGYTVSVQFGYSNYCDNRDFNKGYRDEKRQVQDLISGTAEVAAWDKEGNWYKLGENDDVVGWMNPTEVLEIINKIAAL